MKRRRALGWLGSLGVWAALALVAWLDSDGCLLALRPGIALHTSAIFGAVVAAIEIIGGWLGTAAAATVSYLAVALQFIGAKLLTFIKATGAVFAKSWDALKIVYSDVLKPAVQWMDAHLKRLYSWLHDTFKPVFDFLKRVRQELLDAYKRYVRPVLDVIDVVRGGLRVLGDLGVQWARALDQRLGQVESAITENFLRILSEVNRVIDVLNSVLTLDRLLQRFTFLRTLQRDTRYVWRVMGNSIARPATDDEKYWVQRATVVLTVPEATADMLAYLKGEESNIGPVVDKYAASFPDYLEGNAGDLGAGVTV